MKLMVIIGSVREGRVADKVAEVLKREMESAVTLDVPLVVDVGIADNWMDAKP